VDLPPDFKELLEELVRDAVEFLLVGGYAVAFHGRPRATKDIDIFLEGSRGNLDRAAGALARFGAPSKVVTAIGSMQESGSCSWDSLRCASTSFARSTA